MKDLPDSQNQKQQWIQPQKLKWQVLHLHHRPNPESWVTNHLHKGTAYSHRSCILNKTCKSVPIIWKISKIRPCSRMRWRGIPNWMRSLCSVLNMRLLVWPIYRGIQKTHSLLETKFYWTWHWRNQQILQKFNIGWVSWERENFHVKIW